MRSEKQFLLDEVREMMDRHGSFVIMQYSRMSANTANAFRRQIAGMGGDVEMVNKRILVKAAKDSGVELDLATLPGHIGLVFTGADPIAATKAVVQLSKDSNEAIKILGGRFEGQLYAGVQVEELSKLPGKDEMRAQLLAVLEAPLQQTVGVMNALLCSVLYCLEGKSKKS